MKPHPPTAADSRPPAVGIVRGATDTAYSLQALSRMTGLQEHGLRQLRALGLPMTTIGRERWILGEDFVRLVRRLRDKSGAPTGLSGLQPDGRPRQTAENRASDGNAGKDC